MRQLFLDKDRIVIKEVCRPLLDDYCVLISVSYSFMASGDEFLSLIREQQSRSLGGVPDKIRKVLALFARRDETHTKQVVKDYLAGRVVPIGYSCSGTILVTGKKVKNFRPGDFVACTGDGLANHAELVCVPEHLVVHVPHENMLQSASITGVGAMALQSVRRAGLEIGETVCVFGADTLGQLIMQVARVSGCRVVAVDASESKLAYARQAGAEQVYHLDDVEIPQRIDYFTNRRGVDCVIMTPDCSSLPAFETAVHIVGKRRRIVLVGSSSIALKQDVVQRKEIDVRLSLSYGPGRYDVGYEYQGNDYPYAYVPWTENRNMQAFIDLINSGHMSVDYLTSNVVSLDQLAEALNDMRESQGLGTVVKYDGEVAHRMQCPQAHEVPGATFIPARRENDVFNVTFFGASTSVRMNLMPIVKNIKKAAIHKIIDRDISHALRAAKQYRGAVALSGDAELFYDDPTTDVVLVTATKDVHVEHLIKALQKGKAVYLHQPLAFDDGQLKRLCEFLTINPQARLCLGYHRPLAPFVQKIKRYITGRRSPLMISYRLNLKAYDGVDSLESAERFGSVIERASHVFDLFYFLTEAKPVSISAETVRPAIDTVFTTDNFSVQLSLNDGSVCSLLVTSLGNQANGVERMEVNYDGKTIVMEDFVRLTGFGLPDSFDEITRIPDRGRETYMHQFFSDIKADRRSMLFDLNRLNTVSTITMNVDRLVCQGGGDFVLN